LAAHHDINATGFNFKTDEEIIEELVIETQKVIVIGHSAGGISAVDFCSNFPEKIKW